MSRGVAGASLMAVLLLGACSSGSGAGPPTAHGRPQVVAALYPLAWMAQRIGGNDVSVKDLTPPGAEPHDLELDAEGVDEVGSADLALVMGRGFQPSVEAAAEHRSGVTIDVLDTLVGTEPGNDAHVWLDPVLMARLVPLVQGALTTVDPAKATMFSRRAAALTAELQQLDRQYVAGLRSCKRKALVTAHQAFGRLAQRYGLTQYGIAGFSPDAEPDPRRLAELADLVKTKGVTTVFTEELLPTALADTLARETGVRTAVLSPLEALSTQQKKAGADYLSIMRSNWTMIRAALSCGT